MNTKFFYCSGSLRFVAIEKVCDGKADCPNGEDELVCVSKLRINGTFPGECSQQSRGLSKCDFYSVFPGIPRDAFVEFRVLSLSL